MAAAHSGKSFNTCEEDINRVVSVSEPGGRPDESLVRIVNDDFAFRRKPIGIGLHYGDRDPFVGVETLDLPYGKNG